MHHGHAPLERLSFHTESLVSRFPPRWQHRLKRVVYDIACPPDAVHGGAIEYTRWPARPLPAHLPTDEPRVRVIGCEGFFDYAPLPDVSGGVEWHVNFADPHLFVAYAGSLFAQDEMQVAEHPALGALLEALHEGGHRAVTVDHQRPTPVLVTGVERRCRIATEPDASAGRPAGLYGNAFARASEQAVRHATTPIVPPSVTNLIAMAAPGYGHGRYTPETVFEVLTTAFTAFEAAVAESTHLGDAGAPVVVHTGFWGCGAFGGNRVVMTILQALAAQMAGVEHLVYHTGVGGGAPFEEAMAFVDDWLESGQASSNDRLVETLVDCGYEWGESDGN